MTQTEFFKFSSLYNRSLLRMCLSCFRKGENQSAGVDRGPLGRVGLRGDSFSLLLHLQHLPPSRRSPRAPCTPNSTQRKPSTVSPWGLREAPLKPQGPASGHLFPACSRAAPSPACGDPESLPRSCVGLEGEAPAAPVPAAARPPRRAGDASPRAAEESGCPSASRGPATPDSRGVCTVGGSVRASTASGAARGARAGRSRETAPPGRAGRLGLAAAGPALRPAQPSQPRCGGRRAVASARTADPGVGSRPRGEAPCRAHFPLWKRGALAAGICSVVSGSGDQS